MGLPKSEMASAVANKVGNWSAAGYGLTWVADKVGNFDLQDWVTLLVGVSAIFSYATAGYLNIKKSRQLKKNKGQDDKK